MTRRRTFLKQVASAAGVTGLGTLLAAQRSFADALDLLATDAPRTTAEFAALRERYLLNRDVIYFNHASIGTIPRIVHEAHVRYLEICETNPWLHMWGGAWEEPRESVREQAARLLRCLPTEMVVTHNTTEGFNTLANGLALGPGDEVVFSSLNHDGASECWFHTRRTKGFVVKRFVFPVLDLPTMSEQDILDLYDRHITSRTRVLVFPHVDHTLGLRYPVRRLAALAKSKGVEIVAVDGAQSVGMLDVNLHDLGVDVYCASPHKWLQAPKGLGLMYVRADIQASLRPMWVTWGQRRWEGTSRVFEDYGTRNLPALLALGDAMRFQETLGAAAKERRYQEIWRTFLTAARENQKTVWRSPESWALACSLFAIEIKGKPSGDVLRTLADRHGFVFRAFSSETLNTVRISPNVYNTEEEIQLFFQAL